MYRGFDINYCCRPNWDGLNCVCGTHITKNEHLLFLNLASSFLPHDQLQTFSSAVFISTTQEIVSLSNWRRRRRSHRSITQNWSNKNNTICNSAWLDTTTGKWEAMFGGVLCGTTFSLVALAANSHCKYNKQSYIGPYYNCYSILINLSVLNITLTSPYLSSCCW